MRAQTITTGSQMFLITLDEPDLPDPGIPEPGNEGLLLELLESESESESEEVPPLKFGMFDGSNPSGIVLSLESLSLSLSLLVGGVKLPGIPEGIPDGTAKRRIRTAIIASVAMIINTMYKTFDLKIFM